jgi:hypothetical protein
MIHRAGEFKLFDMFRKASVSKAANADPKEFFDNSLINEVLR